LACGTPRNCAQSSTGRAGASFGGLSVLHGTRLGHHAPGRGAWAAWTGLVGRVGHPCLAPLPGGDAMSSCRNAPGRTRSRGSLGCAHGASVSLARLRLRPARHMARSFELGVGDRHWRATPRSGPDFPHIPSVHRAIGLRTRIGGLRLPAFHRAWTAVRCGPL